MSDRFQVWDDGQGHYEVRDLVKNGYCVHSFSDAERAFKLVADLNKLSSTCDQLGVELLTRDDA